MRCWVKLGLNKMKNSNFFLILFHCLIFNIFSGKWKIVKFFSGPFCPRFSQLIFQLSTFLGKQKTYWNRVACQKQYVLTLSVKLRLFDLIANTVKKYILLQKIKMHLSEKNGISPVLQVIRYFCFWMSTWSSFVWFWWKFMLAQL